MQKRDTKTSSTGFLLIPFGHDRVDLHKTGEH